MTDDSPLWAFEGEVIFEVANLEEGENGILKICLSKKLNPGRHSLFKTI